MTDVEIMAEMQPEILAFSEEDIKRPGVPIFVAICEADALATRAVNDLPDLSQVNCTQDRIDRLRKLGACARVTTSTYSQIDGDIALLQKQWTNVDYPHALQTKADLFAMCDLTFYGDEVLEAKVAALKEGNSIVDTIEDLNHLSILGPANAEKFAAFNISIEPFVAAGELAVELIRKRGIIDGDTYLDSDNKVLRDKALTLLQREVGFIRRCGQFVYRNNPDKLRHYYSAYKRTKNSERRTSSGSQDTNTD